MTSAELWAAIVARVGSTAAAERLTGETSVAHPRLDASLLVAEGIIASKVGRRYALPIDEPYPEPLAHHRVSLVLDKVTVGADRRPESIKTASEEAGVYLTEVSAGKADVPDVNVLTPGGVSVGSDIFAGMISNIFDYTDVHSEISLVRPKL